MRWRVEHVQLLEGVRRMEAEARRTKPDDPAKLVAENEELRTAVYRLRIVEELNAQLQLELQVLRRSVNTHPDAEFDALKEERDSLLQAKMSLETTMKEAVSSAEEARSTATAATTSRDEARARLALQTSEIISLTQAKDRQAATITILTRDMNRITAELQTDRLELSRLHQLKLTQQERITVLMSEADAKEKQLDDLKRQLQVESSRLRSAEQDKVVLEQRLAERDRVLKETKSTSDGLSAKLTDASSQLQALTQQLNAVNTRVALAEEEAKQLRTVNDIGVKEKQELEEQTASLIKELNQRLSLANNERAAAEKLVRYSGDLGLVVSSLLLCFAYCLSASITVLQPCHCHYHTIIIL